MDEVRKYWTAKPGSSADYSQLHRWSPHTHIDAGYGISSSNTVDNTSLIYTSDYGSCSSQESNHSGTTIYSNLADCEEALNSPSLAYDVPPPELFGSMEKRRDKPLPPPRMTSRSTNNNNNNRVVKTPLKQEKKISFDDASMAKHDEQGSTNDDSNVPSFATLPRKKKLVTGSPTKTVVAPGATQVTWMKDVAQKGEIMSRPKSSGTADSTVNNKQPHGILKNKTVEKKGDTSGYIKRTTVQRILDQQKKALNRYSAAPSTSYNQCYNSMPALSPRSKESRPSHKAWEYNYKDNKNGVITAQVIGVLEPNMEVPPQLLSQPQQHVRQNSTETEFEFPAPPSDQDIEQIMTQTPDKTPTQDRTTSRGNDFTPLQMACHSRSPRLPRSTTPASRPQPPPKPNQQAQSINKAKQVPVTPPKPQVPARSSRIDSNIIKRVEAPKPEVAPKPHSRVRAKSQERTITSRPRDRSMPRLSNNHSYNKEITPPPRHPKSVPQLNLRIPIEAQNGHRTPEARSSIGDCSPDIVLPPPPEFQESSPLAAQAPSYGDYELLSPEPQYHCTLHSTDNVYTTSNQNSSYNSETSPRRGRNYTRNMDYNSRTQNDHNQNRYPQYNQTIDYRSRKINHSHQYSTEL